MIFDVLVARYLRRNGLRSLVTAAAVAIAVAISVSVSTINASVGESFAADIHTTGDTVNLQIFSEPQRLDEGVIATVRRVAGIQRANPVVERAVAVAFTRSGRPDELLNLVGIDLTQRLPRDAEIRTIRPGPLAAEGSQPTLERLVNNGVIISSRVARRYNLRENASFAVRFARQRAVLRVAAILPASITDVDSSVLFVDIGTAQALSGSSRLIDRIDCTADPARLAEVRERVAAVLPSGIHVVTREDDPTLPSMMSTFRLALDIISFLAFLVAALLISNTIGASVLQRRSEITILRTLGAKRRTIFSTFLLEGLAIAAVGAAEGLAASILFVGLVVGRILGGAHDSTVPGGVIYDLREMFGAVAAAILLAGIASVLPALGAARESSGRSGALSHGVASRRADMRLLVAGVACAAVGVACVARLRVAGTASVIVLAAAACAAFTLLVLPMAFRAFASEARSRASSRMPEARLASSHLAAVPRSTAVMVCSLLTAVAMLVTVTVVVASYRNAVVAWTNTTLPDDLVVRPNDGLADVGRPAFTSRDVERMRATRGVEFAAPVESEQTQMKGAVAISVAPGAEVAAVRSRLIDELAPTLVSVQTSRELREHVLALFGGTFAIAYGLCALSLLIAIVGMANTLVANVLERTLEIGLLRYLGLRRIAVQRMILIEAGITGGLACLFGLGLGMLISTMLVGFAGTISAAQIGIVYPPVIIGSILLCTMLCVIAAGIYPGRIASRIRTDRAVHVE